MIAIWLLKPFFNVIDGHSLLRYDTREMCSAKMTGTCMRKLTALKMSHFDRECHSVVVFFYTRLSKKQKAAPTVCVLCVMACEDGFMAVR